MVTSPCEHSTIMGTISWIPRGLVPNLLGLRSQFRGDWSQRIAGFTSESDFNTIIAGEEQRDLSYYFFSLTTDIDRASKNPQVPEASQSGFFSGLNSGVRVLFFLLLAVCQSPLVFSHCYWLLWRKATNFKCGSSFRVPTRTKASSISVILVLNYIASTN